MGYSTTTRHNTRPVYLYRSDECGIEHDYYVEYHNSIRCKYSDNHLYHRRHILYQRKVVHKLQRHGEQWRYCNGSTDFIGKLLHDDECDAYHWRDIRHLQCDHTVCNIGHDPRSVHPHRSDKCDIEHSDNVEYHNGIWDQHGSTHFDYRRHILHQWWVVHKRQRHGEQ